MRRPVKGCLIFKKEREMDNVIIIAILVIVIGAASLYIYKEKKHGKRCVGCPYAGGCSSCKGCTSSLPNIEVSKKY